MPQRSMLDGLPPDPQFWVAASSVRGLRVLGCGDREITAPIPAEWAHLLRQAPLMRATLRAVTQAANAPALHLSMDEAEWVRRAAAVLQAFSRAAPRGAGTAADAQALQQAWQALKAFERDGGLAPQDASEDVDVGLDRDAAAGV